jgi:regulator of RNase E activity RraB
MPVIEDETTICVYAFIRLNDQHIRDPDGENLQHYDKCDGSVDGWCVYVRKETPDDPQQPFTTLDEHERNFDDEDVAMAYADALSATLNNAPVDSYS